LLPCQRNGAGDKADPLPLGIGLVLLAITLAVAGYVLTKTVWRLYLIRSWRQRKAR